MPESSKLQLSFELNTAGAAILRVKQQQPPWRVLRGFKTASGETLAHLQNVSGGILDTDCLEWRVDVAPHALAQITSTGATRVYRSRSSHHVASQHAEIRLGEGAYLEYLPDQLIPFSGSRFEQSAKVELSGNASLIWWDLVAPGREASGEVFQYESLSSSFELCTGGVPVALERWTLSPTQCDLTSPARLGRFRHLASCYVCRAGESAGYWRSFESELQSLAGKLSTSDVLWGVTSLRAHGLVIKGVGVNGRPLTSSLVEIWRAAKLYLCGRVATLPRKIH